MLIIIVSQIEYKLFPPGILNIKYITPVDQNIRISPGEYNIRISPEDKNILL